MAYTAPKTWVTGEVVDAAGLNTYLRDNDLWVLTDSAACRAYNSANLSIANATSTAVTLNSERYDNANIHDTSSNTSRFTIPSGHGGKFAMGAGWQWALNGTGNYRQASIKQNGTTFVAFQTVPPSAAHASEATITTEYSVASTDYIELYAKQDSGGALNLTVAANYSPEVWISWKRT